MASVRVPKAGPLKAQLACYYILGQLRYGETAVVDGLPSMLPDTRRGFLWFGNELYYAYCSETAVGEFGVAKVGLTGNPSIVTTINSDGTNHAGFNFTIAGSILWVGMTRIEGNSSRIEVFTETV